MSWEQSCFLILLHHITKSPVLLNPGTGIYVIVPALIPTNKFKPPQWKLAVAVDDWFFLKFAFFYNLQVGRGIVTTILYYI